MSASACSPEPKGGAKVGHGGATHSVPHVLSRWHDFG